MKRKYYYVVLLISFLAMSVVYVWSFTRLHMILGSGDMMFHANRMEELYQDVQRGVYIPRISSYTFNQVGSGINFFYPWLFLYPFVIFRLITHNPISAYYLGIILETFITFCISYYSMHKYSSSKKRAIIFSVLYTLGTYRVYLVLNQEVLAESIAYIFLPLVLLGFYEVFFRNKQKWPILGIGMSLLIYSHMLTTAITAIFMLITLIIFWQGVSEKWQRLINAIKAALLSVLLTAFFLFPFFEQTLNNNLRASWTGFNFVQQPMQLIETSIDNIPLQSVGLLLMVTLLLGFIYIKNSPMSEKYAYFSGLVLVLLTTKLFPWGYFLKTPLANLQFPYRLDGIATLMLAVYLSYLLEKVIASLKSNYHVAVTFSLAILMLISTGLAVTSSHQVISDRGNVPLLNKKPTIKNYYPSRYSASYNLTKENWHNMFYYYGHNGSFDYFPVTVSGNVQNSVVTHKAVINGKECSFGNRLKSRPNQLEYNLSGIKAGTVVKLPILYYKNDVVKVGDNHFTKPDVTNINTVKVKVPKENKKVVLKYKNSIIDNVSLILSVVTWIVVIVCYLKKIIGKRKNNETVSETY